MKEHFCVSKSLTDFTSIAPDHGIEQENRTLKVIGVIIGITQNEKALDKFFLIATGLSKTMHEFENEYGLDSKTNKIQHHEITGGKLARMMTNASSLTGVFVEHGDPFLREDEEDTVYNLFTKEVMNENVAQDIIDRDKIGQQMFDQFSNERLTSGELSVWDKMKKRKIGAFKSSNATTEVRTGDKLTKVKEEQGMLQRLIVISRSRPDLDLKDCIGNYEFGIVPRSLSASDGSLLLPYDKAKILHHLEKFVDNQTPECENIIRQAYLAAVTDTQDLQMGSNNISQLPDITTSAMTSAEIPADQSYKVIFIEGMALVNSITKTEDIKTCRDFAMVFIDRLAKITEKYSEIRLVFDRYITSSLKKQNENPENKGKVNVLQYKRFYINTEHFTQRLSFSCQNQSRTYRIFSSEMFTS